MIRILVLLALTAFTFTGCRHEKPNFVYMPDMAYSPAYKAQKEGVMKPPVEGTVPRDFTPYAYRNDPEGAGKFLKNALQPTASVLARGQVQFNTYCIVCHGASGEGDGSVVVPYPAGEQGGSPGAGAKRFPRPPSLQSDKIRGWSDGRIFHVITMGQNLMPNYASQIAAEDRWAIVHYIRALQRSKKPTAEDMKAVEQE